MQRAFGFAGAPGASADALAAPQANLIKHLVQGVLGGDLSWSLLGLGALIGAVIIAIDEILRRNSAYSLPPLAVGMGMYLPTAVTVMIPVGAALGHLYDRWAQRTANPELAKRMGTLMATGLIVGESLAGVIYAGIVVAFGGKEDPLAIMPEASPALPPGWAWCCSSPPCGTSTAAPARRALATEPSGALQDDVDLSPTVLATAVPALGWAEAARTRSTRRTS